MKLWIDDVRVAPDSWIWSKTSADAIKVLHESGVDTVSFDHDLGGDDTTRPVILWLCENPFYWPNTIYVHSANPVGVEWISGMVERYGPGLAKSS